MIIFSSGKEFQCDFCSLFVVYKERVVFHSLDKSNITPSKEEFSSEHTSVTTYSLYIFLSHASFSRHFHSYTPKLPANHQVLLIRMVSPQCQNTPNGNVHGN